jgi:hypothetical protein
VAKRIALVDLASTALRDHARGEFVEWQAAASRAQIRPRLEILSGLLGVTREGSVARYDRGRARIDARRAQLRAQQP